MRIIVDIQSGPRAGHKVMLRRNQLLVFGRTEWADVVFTNDTRMSAKHFSLESHGDRLQLRDLESSGGTNVNGQRVGEAWLYNGDIVAAGETQLAIRIEGAAKVAAQPTDEVIPSGLPAPEFVEPVDAGHREPGAQPGNEATTIRFTREICRSGLTRLRGVEFGAPGQPAAASFIATILSQSSPLTMLAHPQKLDDAPQAADLSDAVPLFEWLPADGALRNSPLILSPDTCTDASSLIDSFWDRNAIVCVFSRRPTSELIQHLRDATRFQFAEEAGDDSSSPTPTVENNSQPMDHTGETNGTSDSVVRNGNSQTAILGYCWPNVLSSLIDVGQPAFVQRLMDGIDAVLTEDPTCPNTWQLTCAEDFSKTLEQCGFSEISPP